MKSFLYITLIVAGIGFMCACKKTAVENKDPLVIKLHHCTGNIFSNSQARLCFDSVINDSRCPANAVCVWQGMAVCKFSFINEHQTHTLVLSTLDMPGMYNQDTIVSGYKIEFINLLPYPGLPVPPGGNEITAEVKVTKL